MYNHWDDITHTGLCEPLWSIGLNRLLIRKLEWFTMYVLQTHVCDVRVYQRTPRVATSKNEEGN